MTKTDYKKISNVIRLTMRDVWFEKSKLPYIERFSKIRAIFNIENRLIGEFKRADKKFDVSKFISDCEYIK